MTLSDLSLKRPIGAIVANIIILLMGIVGVSFLGVRQYPAIDPPIITVQTAYTGASAEIIESQITEPLERSINGIEGIRNISSQSAPGVSRITVEFSLDADLEKAANDVRDKVSQAQRNLPQDINAPPTVSKADADSDPIIMLAFQSTSMNPVELSEYVENSVIERLQTIEGVSSVAVFGQQRPAMRLWFDPNKMTAHQVTAVDILNALTRENVEMPAGKVRGEGTELLIKTTGRINTEEEFNNLIIAENEKQIVRLRDIGEAYIASQDEESGAKMNGYDGLMLAVFAMPGSNNIQIADEFHKRLGHIQEILPPGVETFIARDRAQFIRQSISDVIDTLFIAIFLVMLIVFVFFRNWVVAVRPLIDIPISLVGTFFVMYLLGYSINIISMLGIVLATGLVVDDGIVVTENIFKKMEEGMDKLTAAKEGTREIFFAVIATSLTLAIVFVPILFLEGFTGKLFQEFGVVISVAVIISSFVALTITPVLNILLGKHRDIKSKFYERTEKHFEYIEHTYRRWLAYFFVRPWLSVFIMVFCFAMIFLLFNNLQSELAPAEDRSFIRVSVTLPEGTDFATTANLVNQAAKVTLDSVPEARLVLARYGLSTSANTGFINVFLIEPNERSRSQSEIAQYLTKLYAQFPQARIIASQEPTISTNSRGLPVQFVLQNLDFEKLREQMPKFYEEVQNSPVFSSSDVDLKFNKPEINISIDKTKANALGVSEKDISTTLNLAFSGTRYGYFLRNNKQYYIIGQVFSENRMMPTDITKLDVRSRSGVLIPLSNLIKMEENINPPILYHFNRYKSATISANPAPGYTIGDGIDEMRRIAEKTLDHTFVTSLAGQSRDFAESSSDIMFAILLALLLIYLILAAQFESFRDPFIIILTVPMAIAGALLSLWIFGQTINIFSQIGMLLLIGIVTKNGILIVEFANQKRKMGQTIRVAVFEAAAARFRPILMTSLVTMGGALPIALALGAAAQSRVSLGIVIVGGQFFSLILTLFVIPVMYLYLTSKSQKSILH
ncbi:MAG: efflux RND transporter permease subunit [Bacteroidales bacterium]|jgi:hydrophobe/amphiphile efflux-1 (HAE1) family protein|nr:efflux RND transporter permease subunit [Bacteroidales bacterium]